MATFLSDGLTIAYQSDGPEGAPPLVLINSLGTNLHMWDAQVEQLKDAVRVIRYDNRGHGASQAPTGSCTLADYGADLLTLLETLGLAHAHLCGISLGGMIAQWFAIHYPERVLSITLANTAARIGNEQIWEERVEAVSTGGLASVLEMILARFLSVDYRRTHPAETQRLSDIIMGTSSAGYIAACLSLRTADLHPELASIQAPALIIGGELDESTPASEARKLHTALPGSQLTIFPAVAHLSNIERPAEFSALVLEHMRRSFPTL